MKFLRNKKIILGVLAVAIVFGGGLMPFHEARADIIDWITTEAVGGIVWIINYLIGWIAATVFAIGGALINFALELNEKVIAQPIVIIGWTIVLGFANLGFVLAIIVIAFATIFRLESYAMKQVLWKLIVVALLVNFSLVIAGAFINISDTVTKIFLEKGHLKATGAEPTAATTLANAFSIQQFLSAGGDPNGKICFYEAPQAIGRGITGFCTEEEVGKKQGWKSPSLIDTVLKGPLGNPIGSAECKCETPKDAKERQEILKGAFGGGLSKAMMVGIASMFFTATFTLLAALTLLAIAFMLMIRFIVLGMLLVLMPLAWLFWIFPGTSNLWQKWWSEFLRWVFFAPAVSFFLYLSVQATIGISAYKPQSSVHGAIDGGFLQFGMMATIGNMILVIGFMLGGLYVANSLSITGAKQVYGAAQGMAKGMGKGIARLPLRGGAAALKGTGLGSALSSAGTKWQRSTNRFARLAGKGLSGIAGGVNKAAAYKIKKGQGVWASTWGGMKAGSGLFTKQVAQWECQAMIGTPPATCGNEVSSTKKPSVPCSRCGATNWKKL